MDRLSGWLRRHRRLGLAAVGLPALLWLAFTVAVRWRSFPRERLDPAGAASLTILDAQGEILRQLAGSAGAWRFEVQGSYSPEGTAERNRLLADERAAATAVYLRSVGVPEDRVAVLPASIPDDGEAPELLRSCTVQPIPLETRR